MIERSWRVCYDLFIYLIITHSFFTIGKEECMSNKDNKGRVLRKNEFQMPDGRYRYRYTDLHGKRHAVYAWKLVPSDRLPKGKKKDISLREKEKNIERDLYDKIDIINSHITVNQLLERYFATKINLQNSTKENYLHLWHHNIEDTPLGRKQVCDVKKSDILSFYGYLYNDRNMALTTLQLYQNILYPAFQLAVDDNILRINPCKGCMKNYVQGSMNSNKVPLSNDEENLLIEFVEQDEYYYRLYPLIVLILETGVRISEALGLTWDDIDFKNKKLSINHQVLYRKNGERCRYYASLPKTKKTREIPLSQKAIDALKLQRDSTYFISKYSEFEVDGYSGFVFINRSNSGKPPTPNTITRSLHCITSACNKWEYERAIDEGREPIVLPQFSSHVLRHTFCSKMAVKGMNPKTLQDLMGHANIAVTLQVYTHLKYEELDKEMRRIESL